MFQCHSGLGLCLCSAGAAMLLSLLISSVYLTLFLALGLLGIGVLLLRKQA